MRFWGWPELFGPVRTFGLDSLGWPAFFGPARAFGVSSALFGAARPGAVGISPASPTGTASSLPARPTGAVDPPHTGPTGAVEPKTANKSAQNHTNSWLFWLAKPFLVAKIEP